MKKAIIIHGLRSHGNDLWFPKEKKILESKGYRVYNPTMSNVMIPEVEKWVKKVEEHNPRPGTILIGHSLGCPTILRFLETAKKPVDKVFLVAPFARDMGIDFVPVVNFVKEPFNWKKIRSNAKEFYVITQNGDPWTPVEYGIEVAIKTKANLKIVEGDDHFIKSLDLKLINDNL